LDLLRLSAHLAGLPLYRLVEELLLLLLVLLVDWRLEARYYGS
jgi:hypothetical protein